MNAEKPQYKVNKGHALNNLGISRFWYFMEKTREIGEMKISDENKSQEAKKYVPTLEQGIKDLKNSVLQFEDFGGRLFPDFEKSGKLNEVQMKQKLFIDEFFNTEIKETLPQNFSHYDLHDNHMNTKFLIELFTKAESFLPIANLGEISLIFNKMKEAVALLDVSLKVIVERDPGNLIRNKIISDLSWLIDLMGQTEMTIKMNNTLINGLREVDDYVKVFVLRNYGHILSKHKQHQEEAKRHMHDADELDKNFPYWSERKMCLFTPLVPHEPLETPL